MISKIFPMVWGTYISSSFQHVNPGDPDYMKTRTKPDRTYEHTIMKFDASSDTLPISRLTQVNLWVYVASGDGTEHKAYKILRNVIANCSWDFFNVNQQLSWAAPGAQGAGDRTTTAIGTRCFTSPGWRAMPIAPADYISWRTESLPLILIPKVGTADQTVFTKSTFPPYIEALYRPATSGIIMF